MECQGVLNCMFLWLNSLSILQTLPQTLSWIPSFQELSSPNSLIQNKGPFIIWLLCSSQMEAHGVPQILPAPPHVLLFLCLSHSLLILHLDNAVIPHLIVQTPLLAGSLHSFSNSQSMALLCVLHGLLLPR